MNEKQRNGSGIDAWVPAFEGQRPPFAPGNTVGRQFEPGNDVSSTHGAYSPRKVEPLAKEIVDLLLADETVPVYAKAPAYRLELWALAKSEAQAQLIGEWLSKQAEAAENGVGDLADERVRSAYLLLHRAETRAASARQRLGLTPSAAARMGKDVAVGRAAEMDVAQRMALLGELERDLESRGWTRPVQEPTGEETHDDVVDE